MTIAINKAHIMKHTKFTYNLNQEIDKIYVFGIEFEYKMDRIYYDTIEIDATIIHKVNGSFLKFHEPTILRNIIGIRNFIIINKYYEYDEELCVDSYNYQLSHLDIMDILDKYDELFKKYNCQILYFDDTKAIIRLNNNCEIQIFTTYLYIENIYLIELFNNQILYRTQYKEFAFQFFTDFGFKLEKPVIPPSVLTYFLKK